MHRWWTITLLTILLLFMAFASARADGGNQAGLVLQFGDNLVSTYCVEFSEPSISGYEALSRAGLDIIAEFSGMGAALCKIQADGCSFPAETCFCQCMGSPCVYWVYHHLVDGDWQYAGFGASSHQVSDGDVEGWAWGEGSPSGGVQPPVVPFDQICAPPATATATPTLTLTPTPIPPTTTPTPTPSFTLTPTWTPVTTFSPTPSLTPTLSPTPTPSPTLPPGVSFWVEPDTVIAGSCARLHWEVSNVQAVFLDGQGVVGQGSWEACPNRSQTFVLRVVTAAGQSEYPLAVTVLQPTATPAPSPTAEESQSGDAAVAAVLPTPTPAESSTPLPQPEAAAVETVIPTPTCQPAVVVIQAPTLAPAVIAAAPQEQPNVVPDFAAAPLIGAPTSRAMEYALFGALVLFLMTMLVAFRVRRGA